MTTPQAVAPVPATSAVAGLASAWQRMASAHEPFMASQRSLSRAAAEATSTARLVESASARMRSAFDRIVLEARREIDAQYRRALLAKAAQARHAQDRRAALARRALSEPGPSLTYLLALNGDALALETLSERAHSDPFAAEVLAAVTEVEESSRALALTVWAAAESLAYLDAVAVLAGRMAHPWPSRSPDLLRYSLDRMAPPVSAERSGRPTVCSAPAEVYASPSTPIQEYDRMET